jgi:hypothetical protein
MEKQNVKEELFRKHLSCWPPENEAAKLYHRFLKEHPEYEDAPIRCIIDSKEMEEDHYGNGGGVENTLIIYREREETDEEYDRRIKECENQLIDKYSNEIVLELTHLESSLRKPSNDYLNKDRIINELKTNIDKYFKNLYILAHEKDIDYIKK